MNGVSKKRVFVGLSGGVDSSVAALRLMREGYEVIGVFIKVWHPDFLVCDWEAERLDTMRVAAHLGIPFMTCDAEAEYKADVADYMISEYANGRTPNPDVMCNKYIKFGAFLRFANAHGADYVATGHYARNREEQRAESKDKQYQLLRGVDQKKDQTYFLWTLTEDQLSRTLFPIGDTPKEQIRKEAERAGIPTALKKDSQGICFLGHIDLKEFLSHYITTEAGDVIDETETVLGVHDGALYYTLGQRHGFHLTAPDASRTPRYVVAKDIKKNTITVADTPPQLTRGEITLTELNEIQPFEDGLQCQAQFRYQQKPFSVVIHRTRDGDVTVHPKEKIETPAVGQSCVLYRADECLGGGIIA